MANQPIDPPIVKEYCEIASALRPMIEPIGGHKRRLEKILPKYKDFLDKLREGRSELLDEIWFSQIKAMNNLYHLDWKEFLSLALLGKNGIDPYGIAYVNTEHGFKETIEWVVTGEWDPSMRKEGKHWNMEERVYTPTDPGWKQEKRVTLLEPAKLYRRWHDVEKENSAACFKSVEDILGHDKFEGRSFLVMPNVKIRGLPVYKEEFVETPLNIQNWFGDNSKVLVSKKPMNPYWDT